MILYAPNYGHSVTTENGTITIADPNGKVIGTLNGHNPPVGGEAEALWDAVQWALLGPHDGHAVESDYWQNHTPEHFALVCDPMHEDLFFDFAEAAARLGSYDAALYTGGDNE